MSRKTNEDIFLGNSMETILAYDAFIPKITEYHFKNYVLELLKNPYDPDNLQKYALIAKELTRPVHVVSDMNNDQVLFTIPALTPAPKTGMAGRGGMTADSFLAGLNRERELGKRNVPDRVAGFMTKITSFPDIVQEVILPIRAILKNYGTDYDVPAFRGEHNTPEKEEQSVAAQKPASSSFGETYDD